MELVWNIAAMNVAGEGFVAISWVLQGRELCLELFARYQKRSCNMQEYPITYRTQGFF